VRAHVQLTRAGELVVVHDTGLTALTGEAIRSEDLTPDLRARLPLGGTREGIPTLPEVLERVAEKVALLIELKHGALSVGTHLVKAVLEAVRSYRGAHAFASSIRSSCGRSAGPAPARRSGRSPACCEAGTRQVA
jgi:glycerophosphoryl diester phosphodiesterase